MNIDYIYKPLDSSLALYINGQGSRRLDNKVSDLSGHGKNGTINGSVYKNGPSGQSVLFFDGIDDYIDFGTTFAKPLKWTIISDLKISTNFNAASVVKSQRGNYTDWGTLFIGGLFGALITNQTDLTAQYATSTISTSELENKWVELGVTINGSNVLFYKNGKLHDVVPQTIQNLGNSTYLTIGRNGAAALEYFTGWHGSTRIYNRDLDAACHMAIYNETRKFYGR